MINQGNVYPMRIIFTLFMLLSGFTGIQATEANDIVDISQFKDTFADEMDKILKKAAKGEVIEPTKVEKKEKSQGVLSKITETVADTVKGTIKVLTPKSKEDKAKKAASKTAKKEPKVNTSSIL